jgi:hypothetical protein
VVAKLPPKLRSKPSPLKFDFYIHRIHFQR